MTGSDLSGICAIVVTYNSEDTILECLGALRGAGLRTIWVVDNASSDSTVDKARQTEARLIPLDTNRGFAAALNIGIAHALGGEYILCLNPDVTVSGEALERLREALDRDPRLGVVGPRLQGLTDDARTLGPRYRTITGELHKLAASYRPARETCPDRSEKILYCDWLVGACLLIRRSAAEHVGPWDETLFMYSEDLEWCWRLRQHGWTVGHCVNAQVWHEGGASARTVWSESTIAKRKHVNDSIVYAKIYGLPYALLLAVARLMRAILEPASSSASWAQRGAAAHALLYLLRQVPVNIPKWRG